jgi:MATE family multidrug resistance protein
MSALAAPVVLAELGWMTMGIVDTWMVGGMGPEAIGAVGIGSTLFIAIGIFGMGLLLGLDTLVSQAFGADRLDECHRWLFHGVVLSLLLAVPLMVGLRVLTLALASWDLDPRVLRLTQPYLRALTWSLPPLLLYASFRRYLQGIGAVRPVMVALVTANLLNLVFNWILIGGRLGAPALGVEGSAWGTVAARIGMAAFLLGAIVRRESGRRPGLFETPLRVEAVRLRQLIALGLPAASQVTLEVGVFAAATALAGRLAPVSLAAHQIALNFIALTYMVPLGVASAGAVRVGQAVGRRDAAAVARAGWTAFVFGTLFMSCAAAIFLLMPRRLIGGFTTDPAVIAIGTPLLFVGAIFQLFDGLQVVATGALRGLGDTRTPMLWNLTAHWLIGLPLGYTLCFIGGLGVIGLWWGLSTGLMICGVALLTAWSRAAARAGTRIAPDRGAGH